MVKSHPVFFTRGVSSKLKADVRVENVILVKDQALLSDHKMGKTVWLCGERPVFCLFIFYIKKVRLFNQPKFTRMGYHTQKVRRAVACERVINCVTSTTQESLFGLAVIGRTSVRYRFGSPFSSKRLWFVDTVL